jgi:hypothetical protein
VLLAAPLIFNEMLMAFDGVVLLFLQEFSATAQMNSNNNAGNNFFIVLRFSTPQKYKNTLHLAI